MPRTTKTVYLHLSRERWQEVKRKAKASNLSPTQYLDMFLLFSNLPDKIGPDDAKVNGNKAERETKLTAEQTDVEPGSYYTETDEFKGTTKLRKVGEAPIQPGDYYGKYGSNPNYR